jgi:hypothetical protein
VMRVCTEKLVPVQLIKEFNASMIHEDALQILEYPHLQHKS